MAFDPEAWLASIDRLMALRPKAMYLTHYGPVERPETLVEPLRQSIRDQAALALAEEGRDDAGRPARLKQAVTAHLMTSAKAHGVTLSDAAIADLLAVDTELNAQGLAVWLERRERRAAAGG